MSEHLTCKNFKMKSIHRRLHNAIKVKWPRVLSNERLYQYIEVVFWRAVIILRRMFWCDYLLWLTENTQARQALAHSLMK